MRRCIGIAACIVAGRGTRLDDRVCPALYCPIGEEPGTGARCKTGKELSLCCGLPRTDLPPLRRYRRNPVGVSSERSVLATSLQKRGRGQRLDLQQFFWTPWDLTPQSTVSLLPEPVACDVNHLICSPDSPSSLRLNSLVASLSRAGDGVPGYSVATSTLRETSSTRGTSATCRRCSTVLPSEMPFALDRRTLPSTIRS